jgi:hypothetical protein
MRSLATIFLGISTFALAACATAEGNGSPFSGLDAEKCVFPPRGALILGTDNVSLLEAGETAKVMPYWTPYPSAFVPVPHRCLRKWRVSPRGLASLSGDRSSITVARSAPLGSQFLLTAHYGNRIIERRYEVIRRIRSPLVGLWQPVPGSCPPDAAISQLTFRDDGRFEVEMIRYSLHHSPSVSGTWSVQGDRLLLRPDYGHDGKLKIADFKNEARFSFTEGILRFDRPWYGSDQGHGVCNVALQSADRDARQGRTSM